MKLRNIFTALAVAAFAFVGCQEEERFLDEVQVSQSTIALDVAGDVDTLTVTANGPWEIVGAPEWLTVSPAAGEAGTHEVTFTAEATEETREATLYLNIADVQQVLYVLQMAEKVETPLSTCAEANAGETGKRYRIKGTVTGIANDLYGNMYITDETGTVYVYGTLYQGKEKEFAKHGIEVGDIVVVEGPQSPYNGSPQLKNVDVISIEKSLIKLEKVFPAEALSLEGGVATALLTVKDGDVEVVIPEDATWLTAGEPTTLGGMVSVELTAAPNEGGARKTTVTFKVNVNDKDYVAMADIEQLGAIKAVTVEEFLAEAEGTALYELTGIVKNIANTTYGNFDLVDATGSVYVYGLTNNGAIGSNDKKFAELGINEGDVVTIVGTRAAYEGSPQVGGTAYLVEHVVAASVSTVADFLAQPVAADKWFKLTGKIANVKSDVYGNFDLVDETGSVYVYGLTTSKVAKNDKSYAQLGLKEGDIVTLVGTRAAYNDAAQVGGPAYYISHEEGAAAVDPWETAVSYSLPEGAEYQTLTNVKYYADATNVYVRLTGSSSKLIEAATDYVTIMIYDTVTGTAGKGFWGWWNNSIGNTEFAAEHCGVVAGTDLTLNIAGAEVAVEKTTDGDAFTWAFAIPRSVNSVLSGSEAYIGILAMKGWDATGAMPAKTDSMIKVTLP